MERDFNLDMMRPTSYENWHTIIELPLYYINCAIFISLLYKTLVENNGILELIWISKRVHTIVIITSHLLIIMAAKI